MTKWFDMDRDARFNGSLTVNGDVTIPSSPLTVGGMVSLGDRLAVSGNIFTRNGIDPQIGSKATNDHIDTYPAGLSFQYGGDAGMPSQYGVLTTVNNSIHRHFQLFQIKDTYNMFIRYQDSATAQWQPWKKFWTDSNFDPNTKLNITGGTLSGSLNISGNLVISGTVDGVDVSSFKSTYDSHDHDGRYYTETESNSRFLGISANAVSASKVGTYGPSDIPTYDGIINANYDWNTLTNFRFYQVQNGNEGFYASGNQPVGAYGWGILQSFKAGMGAYQIYAPHQGTNGIEQDIGGLWVRTAWGSEWKPWRQLEFRGHTHDLSEITGLETAYLGISGTAVNASKLNGYDSSYFATADHTHSANTFMGKKAIPMNRDSYGAGLYTYGIYNDANSSIPYANIVSFGEGSKGHSEVMVSWHPDSDEMFFRGLRDTQANWYQWNKVWHNNNDGSGSGLDADTVDGLEANKFVRNDQGSQYVQELTIVGNGNLWVGSNTGDGQDGDVLIRDNNGAVRIHLDGNSDTIYDSNVNSYVAGNGDATFKGKVKVGSLESTSNTLVANLNAEQLNGKTEAKFAKNESILETAGSGVHSGLNVAQQTVPNMTVSVNGGTVYTDTGMRVVLPTTSVSLSTSSATYGRYDIIYVRGSSAGANEGTLTVATGTPASTPTEPSIPSDAIRLARILVPQNIGSIQNTHITDQRNWRNLKTINNAIEVWSPFYMQPNSFISSLQNSSIEFRKPIKATGFSTSLSFPSGTTSLTWTHNLAIGTTYTVQLSCNSAEPHIYWSDKATNSIKINLDDVCDDTVIVDVVIFA